jgi:hypothetical protein
MQIRTEITVYITFSLYCIFLSALCTSGKKARKGPDQMQYPEAASHLPVTRKIEVGKS